VPSDKVNLRFLLVNGRKTDMLVDEANTIDEIKKMIWTVWPDEWEDEYPKAPDCLRVLHQGRFLETGTLESKSLTAG
ncbi:hypothetical protein BC832DRAFT_526631, partial [Gaertneriomyces semiglobifer]